MIGEWERGRWVRLTDGTVAYVRRVNYEDEPITYDLRLPDADKTHLYDVPRNRIKCYVEQRTVWVDVGEEAAVQ